MPGPVPVPANQPALITGSVDERGPATLIVDGAMQPDVKVVLDLDGVIRQATLANTVADETLDGWLGRPWVETVEDMDDARLAEIVRDARQDGVSPFFRLTQHFPSGRAVPIEYMAVRTKGGVVAVGRDVRAVAQLQSRLAATRQSMERSHWQLREVEGRYRLLFETSSDALAVIRSGDFAISEANPAAIAALGLASEQPAGIGGRDFLALVRLAERQMVEVTLRRARQHGKAPRILTHLGSSAEPWLMHASVLDVDQADFLLVHLTPSTEAHAAAAGALAAGVPAALPVERAPDGIVALDHRGYVISANPAFLEQVQAGAAGEVIGKALGHWMRSPGGDAAMLLDGLKRAGAVRLFPTTLYGALGSRLSAEVSAVRVDTVKPPLILAYIRDVSSRLEGQVRHAPLAQLLGSMTETLGTTRLKGLVAATVGLVERHYIEAALSATGGNRTAAARLLGLSRQGLYAKLSRYGIDNDDGED